MSERARFGISPAAYRTITLGALGALVFIIVTGASVRLTGSGLGCSDWPTCEQDQFVAEIDNVHAMVEFVNRLITGLVSVAVILAVLGSVFRRPRRRDLTWWSVGLVVGVLVQIVLGAVVVKLHLTPASVIGHFLVSVVLVWNAVVLHDKAGHGPGRGVATVPATVVRIGRGMVAAAAVTIVAGTVVTATGPHGGDQRADRLDLEITEVVRVHAVAGWTLLVLTAWAIVAAHRAGAPATVTGRGRVLVGVLVAQGTLGYLQYVTGVPPLLVGLHVFGSVAVWIAVLRFHLGLFAHAPEPTPPAAARDLAGVGA